MMGDPWTYQISVGLGPPPGPVARPIAARCPACDGPMRASLFPIHGTADRYWHCLTCNLTIPRPHGDPP